MDRENGIDLAEEDEDSATGSVSWKLYWAYFTSGLPGCLVVALWLSFFLGSGIVKCTSFLFIFFGYFLTFFPVL